MIPVYYDESDNNWKKADSFNADRNYEWYDYDNRMWANAVTVSDTNRATYLSANAGTTIPMEDINAMFVWIPRYKYTYFASSTPVEIPITFEKGVESTGTIKCTDAISANSGKSQNCTDATNGALTVGTSTYTHPAFTFGSDELTGIWVGKFENSGEDTPIIKPNVTSSEYISLSMFYKYSRNMELTNNIYGFSQNGTTLTATGEISGDSNNLDTHIIKNMEWGAVAYLSHSMYGNGGYEISINDSGMGYGGNENSLTGCRYGEYTELQSYNTDEGLKTSTTENVYGIYDMAGGVSELVMANKQDESDNFSFIPEYWEETLKPLDKYYDKYSCHESTNFDEYNYGKLGDATVELQPTVDYNSTGYNLSWYEDLAHFFDFDSPWLVRGGYYQTDYPGLFYFAPDYGDDMVEKGSRIVLSITP